MFGFFEKKPQRNKEVSKISLTSAGSKIEKCIKENAPTNFIHCNKCDYTGQCNRLRKRMFK